MHKRNIQPKLERALSRSPVVLLTGARQTGKSTLMQQINSNQKYGYITFDDLRFLSAAQSDPIGFIAELPKPVILDEVQRVPELFLAIKHDVDFNRTPGRYALTGSANPLLLPRLGDSLAGRMEILTLFPLSQGELLGKKETFIDTVFNNKIPHITESISPQGLYQKVICGGYPLVQEYDYEGREAWFNGYVSALLQKDITDLAHITGLSEFPRLLKLLAVRASTLVNNAELSRTCGLSISTLHRYLTLLETLFLIRFLPPWSTNLGKRLVKTPKLTLVDTGLLSYLLGVPPQRALADMALQGHILENFVVNELTKQATWCTQRVEIFHCRTHTGIEVDIVLEDAAGSIVGIEVKNSQTVTATDFKGLRYMQELMGEKFKYGIVLYTGSQHIAFDAQLHALPINALWTL